MLIRIAIDGPSGAGKSTIARALANEFGITYADTGAMYRAVALYALRNSIDPKDDEGVRNALGNIKVDVSIVDGVQCVFLNGENVTALIRKENISKAASDVSAIPEVRNHLLILQKHIAERGSVVMDGRDIATNIMPDAEVKLFLTASVGDRALRRYNELVERGEPLSYDEILADMKLRDANDSQRAVSPLRQAEDAIKIDTTGNSLKKTLEIVSETVRRALKQ